MLSVTNVLVVGAGIAGLAVAGALHRQGITVGVVERSLGRRNEGLGLFLPGNAVRALDALSVRERLAEHSAPIPGQQLRDHRGRLLAEIPAADLWQGTGECLGTTRSALHAVLRDALPVPVREGVTLNSLHQNGDGVHVRFGDESSSRYDVVVGADGIRSQTRQLVNPAAGPRFVGHMSWRFLTDDPVGIDRWTVWLGRGVTFLAYPVGSGRLYCYADLSVASPDLTPDALPPLTHLFSGFDDRVLTLLNTPEARLPYVSPVEEVVESRWADGRVVLVGDAAHAVSPNMAQGVAMALEDALVLADLLGDDGGERAVTLLKRFVRRRRPRVDWVRQQTHLRDRTRGMHPALRNLILRHGAHRLYERNYGFLRTAA